MGDDIGARTYDWLHVVRRARLGRTTTAIALLIASYANPDGTRVFPGIASLAVAAEADYKTVQTALACLRRAGLIELVHRAGRRGDTDEYRLILAEDLLDRVVVLSPAQFEMAAEEERARRRTGGRPAPQPKARAEVVDNRSVESRSPDGPQPNPRRNPQAPQPNSAPHLSPNDGASPIDHDKTVTGRTTNQPLIDLGPQVTTARASPRSRICPHGNSTRRRRDGTPRCPLCPTERSPA